MKAREISGIAICAAAYALAIGATAFIPTPWGVGHFSPGVVVPGVFAIWMGPVVGGLGAALGRYIGDVLFLTPAGLTDPLLALIAGVPSNFVAFYLLGAMTHKLKSWPGFVVSTMISLIVGNFMAASLVGLYMTLIVPKWAVMQQSLVAGIVVGLALYWIVTMAPFMYIIVPAVLRAGGLKSVTDNWKEGRAASMLAASVGVSLPLLILYLAWIATPFGNLMRGVVGVGLENWVLISALLVISFGAISYKIGGR